MKIFNFSAVGLIGATLLATSAFAQSGDISSPTLALTKAASGSSPISSDARLSKGDKRGFSTYSVDFLPGSNEVAGVNFDIEFKGGSTAKIGSCGESFAGTHVARCEVVDEGRIRVLIFSAPVKAMGAGEIFSFSVGSKVSVRIDPKSVAVSDLVGNMIDPEVL